MDALFGLILLGAFIGFCFWKYPALMKEIFSFKKEPVEPVPHTYEPVPPVAPVPGKALSRADSLAYENISDINEPIQQVVAKPPRHEVVKHDYDTMYHSDPWPRWTCRCGKSGYEVVSHYTPLHKAEAQARKSGALHVRTATEADRKLEQSNGKFAF